MAGLREAKVIFAGALKKLISKDLLKRVGDEAAGMIKKRTQLGYGVGDNAGERERLKPLSPGYKKQRSKSKLSSNTSPTKSNLTKTGQLLSSIGVKKISEKTVSVGPKGARRDGLDNEEVGDFVTQAGRPFNNLSNVEKKRLTEFVRKELEKKLKIELAKLIK